MKERLEVMKLSDVKVFAKDLNFNFCFVNSDGVFILLNRCLFGSVVADFFAIFIVSSKLSHI